MTAESFAKVRTWLDGWCSVPADSRREAERFLAEAKELQGGDIIKVEIVPQVFGLEYLSAAGKPSQRTVRIHTMAISTHGAGVLQGYCEWRKSARTFRIDRIKCVIDADGEIHSPAGPYLRDLFSAFAVVDDAARASGIFEAFISRFAPDFMVLKIMAGIDQEVLDVEIQAIEDYAARQMIRFDDRLTTSDVKKVGQWVRRLMPESGDLEDAYISLEERPESELVMLLQAGKAVMEADGRHDPRELRLLSEWCEEFDVGA